MKNIKLKFDIGQTVWYPRIYDYNHINKHKPCKDKVIEIHYIMTDEKPNKKEIKYLTEYSLDLIVEKNLFKTKEKCTANLPKVSKKMIEQRIKYLQKVMQAETDSRKKKIRSLTKELSKLSKK